jgi:hypothetical protein
VVGGEGERVGVAVDGHDGVCRPDRLGGEQRDAAGAGAEIEHTHAQAETTARARASTASIIPSVSLPVNVFCWLG